MSRLLLASILLLPVPCARGGELLRCSEGVQCSSITEEELPDCRRDYVQRHSLESCPHSYEQPPDLWVSRPGAEDCPDIQGLLRNDCNPGVLIEGDLNITMVPHNKAEANITVSWAHLNLNVAAGSVIELKLFDSPCTYCPGSFSFCVSRHLCTTDTAQTSMVIAGVKYTELVTAVQLAVVADSTPTTLIRTTFVDRMEDFRCTNVDIFQYHIERCPPPRYTAVRNLEASVSSSHDAAMNISWQAPAEDDLFHASLYYHMTLTLDNSTQYFTVTPVKPSVSLLIGLSGQSYSVEVKPYVHCSGCGQASSISGHLPSPHTLPPTTLPPTTLPPTTLPPTTTTTNSSAPTTPALSSQGVMVYYAAVAPVVAILVVGIVLAIVCHTLRKKPSSTSVADSTDTETGTPSMTHNNIQAVQPSPIGDQDCLLYRQTSDYIKINPQFQGPVVAAGSSSSSDGPRFQAPSFLHVLGSPSELPLVGAGSFSSSDGPRFPAVQAGSPNSVTMGELSPVRAGSPSTMRLSEDSGSDTDQEWVEQVLSRPLAVLVVYSLKVPDVQRKDILSNLVEELDHFKGIDPVCCDIVSRVRKPSLWLQHQVPEADFVLCVCTENCVQDWEVESTMLGTLKRIIETKICKDETYSNFATILLNASDEKYVPFLLQRNINFMIDDLHSIVSYVMGKPPCVLPHRTKR